jgi:hypothetical protein
VLPILGRNPSRSARRHVQALGMPDGCVWHTWIFAHTECELCILWLIGTKRYACKFVVIFSEHWLKIQTCRTNFWWPMRHIFICMEQLISRT